MIKILFVVLILGIGYNLEAQITDCKVMKPEISGTYEGGCKNGLAHGKGIGQGIDRYEGEFAKGLPNGKGTYRWASGIYYEGEWRKGLKEGEGKMVYPDSIVTGLWKEDNYVGKKALAPFKVLSSMSVSRYTITKSTSNRDGIKIRLLQGGTDNTSVEDFSLAYDSGSEYRNGNYYGIENVRYPLTVIVKYRSWNQIRTSQFNVNFEFVISQPGSWDVVIIN
jgi:hypothetical protein